MKIFKNKTIFNFLIIKQESQRDLETELQDVHQLYTEVKTTLEATAATLEDLRENRKCWLSKFEEIQKKVSDGKMKQMQIDLNRMIEEKQTRIDSMRHDADQILTELRDAVVERDCLKRQLTGQYFYMVSLNLSLLS